MLSVIITSFKEPKTIGKAIQAVLDNNLKEKYEILVLAPDRETLDSAREFSKKNKKITLIKDPGQGKSSALNLVFEKAKGEILILTDGDVYISPDSLKHLLNPFEEKTIGAVSGHPVSVNSEKSMLGFWSHLLSDTADLRRKKAIKTGKRFYCSGYLYALRKNLIQKIPEETLSEDGLISHMIYEKGFKIAYSPESKVYIKYPANLKDWFIQKRRSAGGYNQIKLWTGATIRSFSKESSGVFDILKYPKNLKQYFYTFILLFVRIWLWILIFFDINVKKKNLKTMWKRAESTK